MRVFLSLIVAVAACGCSFKANINVKDAATRMPVGGLRIERHREVSRFEKVINPVGAFYHPHRLADSGKTDTNGDVTFAGAMENDRFHVFGRDARPLIITVFGQQVQASPQTAQASNSIVAFSVWMENGVLKQSSWEAKPRD